MLNLIVNLNVFSLEAKKINRVLEIKLPECSKVIDLLYELSYRFPEILIIDDNRLSYVLCLVNNTAVTLNKALKDYDKISILPLIDGG